jgi:excisionase family DNA binding protein
MGRVTQTISPATAAARVPESALDMERAALDALADLDDDTFVEVEITEPRATRAFLPVGYLRQYLAAQFVPGREVLMFDSDEEVTVGIAASMLGVSRRHLGRLLDAEEIPHRRAGNRRLIRVVVLDAYLQRRERPHAALQKVAGVVNESAGGWTG